MSLQPVAYRHSLDHLTTSGSLAESARAAGLTRADLHHALVTDPVCRETWQAAKRRRLEPDRVTPAASCAMGLRRPPIPPRSNAA